MPQVPDHGHSQAAYQRMGRLLTDLSGEVLPLLAGRYLCQLMPALARCVSRARHANVLQHIMGYLKRRLNPGRKAKLLALIEAYRRGDVALVALVMALIDCFQTRPDDCIAMPC